MSSIRTVVAVVAAASLALPPPKSSPLAPAAPPAPVERQGTFVPAGAVEVKLDLESFQGPLTLVQVAAHGALVREGDVLARFELAQVDEAIAAAERDLRSTEVRHQNQREQSRLDVEATDQRVEDTADALTTVERQLELYEKHEVELKKRGNDLATAGGHDAIDDQKDELAQLEKMYSADELVDATEEIVLKRSRRALARTQESIALQEERRRLDQEFSDAETLKAKRNAVRSARQAKERLARQVEMEKRAREDALSRLDPEMQSARDRVEKLRRDREKLTLRAPKAGVALHGALDDYRPGRSAARWLVGGGAANKQTLFTLAPTGKFAVALDVPESLVLKLDHGMAVKIVPAADDHATLLGRLSFDRFPSPRSAGGPENTYDGTVELDTVPPSIVAGMRCKVVVELPAAPASGS